MGSLEPLWNGMDGMGQDEMGENKLNIKKIYHYNGKYFIKILFRTHRSIYTKPRYVMCFLWWDTE